MRGSRLFSAALLLLVLLLVLSAANLTPTGQTAANDRVDSDNAVDASVVIPLNNQADFTQVRSAALDCSGFTVTRKFCPPQDFSSTETLDLYIANRNEAPNDLEVRLQSKSGAVTFAASIHAGSSIVWHMPLFHLNYTSCRSWPSQPGISMSCSGGSIDLTSVESISFTKKSPLPLSIRKACLGRRLLARGWIDRFGQNKNLCYKSKVSSDRELKHFDSLEQAFLKKTNQRIFGKEKPSLPGTGFFRLEKVNGIWWLVSPEGHLFYSTAIDCVGGSSWTRLTSRAREAHEWLPSVDSPFAAARRADSFSIHTANLIRKWGSDYQERDIERTLARMRRWGFNTLGNWTAPEILQKHAMPYVSTGPQTWTLNIPYLDGDIPDVYHPLFEAETQRAAAPLAVHKQDNLLIGYFIDNELPWWNIPYDVFALENEAPAKVAWLNKLRTRYRSITDLNRAWGTDAKSFHDLRWPGECGSDAANNDVNELLSDFAERFYGAWYRAVKKADANHLVLGSRIPYPLDSVVTACAKYTDVLSFNNYDIAPGAHLRRYHEATGKPIIIGEYGFDSLDAGLLTAYVPVQNQAERGVGYRFYTEQAAAQPFVVGTHYFQYLDEPITGRLDGETSFNGLVAVTDIPYRALVQAARTTNERVEQIHAGRLAPFNRRPRQ